MGASSWDVSLFSRTVVSPPTTLDSCSGAGPAAVLAAGSVGGGAGAAAPEDGGGAGAADV